MELLFLDQQAMDELYPTFSDFWETFGRPWSAKEKAALRWRMPEDAVVCAEALN